MIHVVILQLTAMDKAVERPVVVGEVLRYARVVRPITSAPTGWNERIPWIPRDPFKPGNLCIAASRLRKYQTEIEEKKRGERPAAGRCRDVLTHELGLKLLNLLLPQNAKSGRSWVKLPLLRRQLVARRRRSRRL